MHEPSAVLQRVRDPKYAGWLPRDAPDVGSGEAGSMNDATLTRIQLRVDAATGHIVEAVFRVFGCSAAIASASLVAERLHGARLRDARELEALPIVAELQLPLERAHVAGVAVDAARAAIADWEKKQ
jgi:NifU-like protein involved in Fe-S cluster formation